MGKSRIIDWDKLTRDRGYTDTIKMLSDLKARYGTNTGVCNDLGISTTAMHRVLDNNSITITRKCRHCQEEFEYNPAQHNKMVCNKDQCKEIEIERKRRLKSELTAKKRAEQRELYKKSLDPKMSKKACPECGRMMEKYNRIKCKACWGAMRSNGPNMIDAYGECAVQYG